MSAVCVELIVQTLQHVDDHERRGGATNRCETDDITEQHCDFVVCFCFDRLPLKIIK